MNQQPFSCRQSSGQPSWEPHVPPDYGRPPQSGQSPGSPSSQGWPDRSNGASQLQKLPSLFQCSKAAAKKKHVGIGYSLGCGLLILLCSFFTYVATVGGSGKTASASTPQVLVFNGAGTSTSDETLLAQLLASHGFTYHLADSAQLAAMSLDELASYQLILWPGGDSITMTKNLSAVTREKVREAVVYRGVNYAGFCAGAFMAVGLTAPTRGGWGLGIVPGNYLHVYYPPGISNPSPASAVMVKLSFPGGSHNEMYWQDGPALLAWSHGIISKYSNGQIAMSEIWSGKGFVVLSGVHPEATQGWLTAKNLVDPDGLDADVAWNLIHAAYTQKPLLAF